MKLSRKALVIIVIVALILAIVAGVFFFYESIRKQHSANQAALEKFGFQIVPNNPYTESVGELGQKQLPATFAEAKLQPADKVIKGLMNERKQLLAENKDLKKQIEALKQQVTSLKAYKQTNKQFAPKTLEQKLTSIRLDLKAVLRKLPEARQFSDSRIDLMATAGQREYRLFIDKNPMQIDAAQQKKLINHELLDYSFCVGKAVDLAVNSPSEEADVAAWFKDPSKHPLQGKLKADMNVVLPPCQISLRKQLAALLDGASG